MSDGGRLSLVVSQGPDVGARLELDASPRVVGRAREAALVLTDPATSRRHAEVTLQGGAVVVRVLPGASPLVVNGETRNDARLGPDARFVLGTTTLTVVRSGPARPAVEHELTDVRMLLQGAGADARGLGAMFALVDALDADGGEGDPLPRAEAWAHEAVGATGIAALDEDEVGDPSLARLRAGEIVIVPAEGGSTVLVPARAASPFAVRFELALRPDDVGLTVRRMLVVGARVLAQSLRAFRDAARAREEHAALREQAVGSARAFLGTSPAADEVARLLPRLSASDATVLLLGESGSGKTFLARLIHEGGPREREPFRVVNCAAIPENLMESALFGHERGAFTGASVARAGVFEAASGGTVLLDEIGEMPLASQAKLLRVLEDKVFERIGSHREVRLRARVLAATNRDLGEAVKDGTFRSDLFFRISVVGVRLPSLRERGDDVLLLAERILADLSSGAGRRLEGFDDGARAIVRAYAWPGNVRELRNAIEHAIVLGDGPVVRAADLPPALRAATPVAPVEAGDSVKLPARLDWLEARAIEAALQVCGGNRTRAAALLGINRVTLYKKLKEPDPVK